MRVNRAVVTMIVGVIGTVLSALGVLQFFVPFLTVLGVTIPPIAGIMVVDYFLLRRYREELDESASHGGLPALVRQYGVPHDKEKYL
jgi:cytosine permease